jgi:hypothetical protein
VRVAALCDAGTVLAWHARCLETLFETPGVEAVALIFDERRGVGGPHPPPPGLWRAFPSGYVQRRSRALRPVDIRGPLAEIPRLTFDDNEDAVALGLDVDVLMHFSPRPAPAGLARAARRGVWTVELGGAGDDTAAVLSELRTGTPVVSAALLRCAEGDAPAIVLGRAYLRVRPHSYVRTLDDALFGAAPLAARACRALVEGAAPESFDSDARDQPPARRAPTNRDVLAAAARIGRSFVRAQVAAIAASPQWNVGVVDAPIHRFLDDGFEGPVHWFPRADRGRFVADPFGLPEGAAREFLVESFDYRTNRGVIAAAQRNGAAVRHQSVLEVESHASYPFLVRHRGDVYCVPQLEDVPGIAIFRAVRYPTHWEPAGVLIDDVVARDATPFEHDGRWWLAFADGAAPLTNLHVWWADDLLGEWRPHVRNPVKVDARSSRPAGTPFVHDGTLYRPAQDCSRDYGGGVAICRVDVLTPTEFRETIVRVVRTLPGPYGRGTHTLSSIGNATLVDGKRLVFTLAGSRHAIRSRLARH